MARAYRATGLVMGFGAGTLLSAIAYEHGGSTVGLLTVLGYLVAAWLTILQ
jgi:hypothetical protein